MEEASDWASRRKTIYLGTTVLLISALCFFIFWKFWYTAPTCSDKIRNGDETGVDCGGSCSHICAKEARMPIVKWDPRLFEPLAGVWSAIVYVENPNTDADAVYVPYKFVFYGEGNNVIYERQGATVLPKNKTVGVFEGSITFEGGAIPKRATFEVDEAKIVWRKNNEEDQKIISISHTPLLRVETAPRIEATVENKSLSEVKNIELVAVVFDGRDNAIAASRTFINRLKKDEIGQVFFTWPKPFELGTRACSRKSDTILLLDRSGSMASTKINPPEPLTSAKSAAISFVDRLTLGDRVGVLSFATKATNPPESSLTPDFDLARTAIGSIAIATGTTQYTNIYDALHEGWSALVSQRGEENRATVVVLLTDGVANNPKDPSGRTEAEDIAFAEQAALSEAVEMKKDKVEIYTIGLGQNVNKTFLSQIASLSQDFFFAPTAEDLASIYKQISSEICKEVPARIEITYKIIDA